MRAWSSFCAALLLGTARGAFFCAVLAGLPGGCRERPRGHLASSGQPAVLAVRAPQAGADPAGPPDGSEARPFPTIPAALAAAPEGALIELGEGTFPEPLVITRPVVLRGRGPGLTMLAGPPGARGTAVTIRGTSRVELRGLAIEGWQTGVFISGGKGHVLDNVALRRLGQAGLVAHDAELTLSGSEILEVGHGQTGSGVVLEGGSLEARTCFLRAAGRRAFELKGARATLADLDVAGSSLSALQAIDGADVTVRGSRFQHLGGAALYAGNASLLVEDSKVLQAEFAVIGFRGAKVELRRTELRDQHIAAASFVRSSGKLTGCLIVHGGTEAAVTVTVGSAPLVLLDNRILDPGPMGVHVTESKLEARGNTITGARLDLDKDLGDAIYAIDSEVSLEGNELSGNAGSGVALVRSKAEVRRNDLVGNGRTGLLLLDRSRASASANLFQRNTAAGIEVGENSRLTVAGNHFGAGERLDIDLPCGQGGDLDLRDGNTFAGGVRAHQRSCP